MSLKDEYRAECPIAPGVRNRILILDVERLPGITKQYWWDRGDLKNRYIHYETVERQPRTTIVCAKWYDRPDVIQKMLDDIGDGWNLGQFVIAMSLERVTSDGALEAVPWWWAPQNQPDWMATGLLNEALDARQSIESD